MGALTFVGPESTDERLELSFRLFPLAAVFLDGSLQPLEFLERRTVVERNSLLSHVV
jgi:hypothetical protein